MPQSNTVLSKDQEGIAVIGLAGRFPDAPDVRQFWRNLCNGVESVSFFSDEELEASGIDTHSLPPNYVKARAILEHPEWFDAGFFGYGPREAERLDPQQRIFLETAWEALEDASCDPERFAGLIGVFAGMANNTYYLSNLLGYSDPLNTIDAFATMISNEKDYLSTRTSYKLNLKGPSVNINTACSTSLVAVCQACHSLMSYQCDLALSGGVAVRFPQKKGSLYQKGGMASADGHCRAFDAKATGMVSGEGAGVVVLRRLSEALEDGDHIYAIIRGFAVNNDGAHKVGYTAPSVEGQAEVIAEAQALAEINPETITYIEAHGTGTPLGDPIEVFGLTRAFRAQTEARAYCALGSVKTNIGHLDAAAGVTGLIKTVLAVDHGQLPPSLHFSQANPEIDFASSPFFVNDRLRDWNPDGPRRAGVSSFGIGGTNAHVVLEVAPPRKDSTPLSTCQVLPLSAKSPTALTKACLNLAEYLKSQPNLNLADVAYTLQFGRQAFTHRRVVLCSNSEQALAGLEESSPLITLGSLPNHIRQMAELWVQGGEVDWHSLHTGCRRHKVPLPSYPFERQRYWVTPIQQPLSRRETNDTTNNSRIELVDAIRDLFQELSGLTADQMSGLFTIADLEMDSLGLAQASLAIERKFGVTVSFRQLQEGLGGFIALAEYIATQQIPSPRETPLSEAEPYRNRVELVDTIRDLFQEIAGLTDDEMSRVFTIEGLRLDSLGLAQASLAIERKFGVAVGFRQLQEDFAGFIALAEYIATHQSSQTDLTLPDHEDQSIGPFQPARLAEKADLSPAQRQAVEKLIVDYTSRTVRSKQIAAENRSHYADPRAAAGFRQQWKEMVYPIVVERSSGSKLWDVDGNEYVDMLMGFGVNLFGHSPEFVTRALHQQLELGVEIGPQSPLAGQVAASICRLTGTDRATFCNTGSEAVLAALRIARTTTNRDKVVLFAGSYHGVNDEVLVRRPTSSQSQLMPVAAGIPANFLSNLYVLEYGDSRSLEFISEHAGELAAVLVEPVQSRHPELQPRKFLHQLRRLTEDHDVALIFDEIITGFRCHQGGAQAHFDVRADIVTYGKVLGGGLPIGIVAGKSHFMDALDGGRWQYGDSSGPSRGVTYFAGTFVRHPLAIAAAEAVLRYIEKEGPTLQENLNARTVRLAGVLQQLITDSGIPLQLGQFASLMFFRPTEKASLASLLFYHLRARGVHLWEGRPGFLSTVHTDEDIATIESAFEKSLSELSGRTVIAMSSPPDVSGRIALPMTSAQTDLWLAASMSAGASLGYNLTYMIHARGPLSSETMSRALQDLVDRHEALRTTFDETGRYQFIAEQMTLDLRVKDVSALTNQEAQSVLEDALVEEGQKLFDLENGPLFRAQIVKLDAEHHCIILSAHHLVVDGWSFGVLLKEMGHLYSARLEGTEAALAPPLPTSHYARLEQEQLQPAEVEAIQKFWLIQFADLPESLELPKSGPHPSVRSYRAATESFVLVEETIAQLRRTGKELGCGLIHMLLASFSALLHRLSASDDFVIGIPAASPVSAAGLRIKGDRSLIGDHVNLLPLRMRHRSGQTFAEHVNFVRELLLSAYEHQNFTFGNLVRQLEVPRIADQVPLVSVTFNVDHAVGGLAVEGVAMEVVIPPKCFDVFDLRINISEASNELRVDTTFNTDFYNSELIRAWLSAWRTLLDGAISQPKLPVESLPLLSRRERQTFLERMNATDCAIPEECVHHLFEEQVLRSPQAIALEFEGVQLSYCELNERANQLAHRLVELGVGTGMVVGLCVNRSPELFIGILGILKAGAAYLPLETDSPPKRTQYMLSEADVTFLIAEKSDANPFFTADCTVVNFDSEKEELEKRDRSNPGRNAGPEDLAYVIYTSGSTGEPKGVAIRHRSLLNLLTAIQPVLGMETGFRFLGMASPSFDISVAEIFLPLIAGGTTLLLGKDTARDPDELAAAIAESEPDIIQATPTSWQILLDSGWTGGDKVLLISTGEALPRVLAGRLLDACGTLYDFYGPTEATIWSTIRRVTKEALSGTIGRPIANTQVYVLDAHQQPVPVGIPGELYIGGAGLAFGYLNQPELTEEKFISNPFNDDPDLRLYRTGDLCRWSPDGELEFLGRMDHQVKLRGYRIELREIESVMNTYSGIKQSVVVLLGDDSKDKRLAAYYVTSAKDKPGLTQLRSYLGDKLPKYMIPAVFIPLDSLPQTASGKIDRSALPLPDESRTLEESAYVAPRNPIEESLATMWSEVFSIELIGIHDDFFELGGDSLLAIKLQVWIKEVLQVNLPLRSLFDCSSIAKLSGEVAALMSHSGD